MARFLAPLDIIKILVSTIGIWSEARFWGAQLWGLSSGN